MGEYPLKEKMSQMKKEGVIFPTSVVLMILSVFPLAFGLAGKNLWLSVPGGALMVISIAGLFISAYRMKSLSDEMLRESEAEMTGMAKAFDFLEVPSPSPHLH